MGGGLAQGALEHDPLAGAPAFFVSGGAVRRDRTAAAAPGIAPAQVGKEGGIALPDQALALALGGARGQLLLEADHHAEQEPAPLAIAGDGVDAPVIAPEAIAGLEEE